eukprot:2187276-Prymnesium_polylepis.1
MSTLLPGGARGLSLTWQLAETSYHAFGPSPATRWCPGSMAMEESQEDVWWGAFAHSVELFDCVSFGISVAEASTMDPQQRHLLELGYEALHTANFQRALLSGTETGVFVGVMSTEFRDALSFAEVHNMYSMTGTGHCFAAGRLSYVLGLHGACEAVDTACSASLVACHHTCRTVVARDCATALLAGVNMMFLPSTTQGYAAAGILSVAGKAFVFDERADGFVRGEACSAGVLGRLTLGIGS